jgi:hypothetical protein
MITSTWSERTGPLGRLSVERTHEPALPESRAVPEHAAAVTGGPALLLRLEGAVELVVAIALYAHLGGSPGVFAAWFLLPDLSMLGYLAGPRAGAAAYNAAHALLGPAALAAASVLFAVPALVLVALVWVAHVGFDRMLGYGLKYGLGFGDTHLGRLGRKGR